MYNKKLDIFFPGHPLVRQKHKIYNVYKRIKWTPFCWQIKKCLWMQVLANKLYLIVSKF